jgi:ubiquinone biosynthesis protein
MEMDFRLEAAAASEFAENSSKDTDFRVPTVDWDRTSKDVFTMQWMDGIPLSDIPALERAGHDLPALGRTVIQSFLRHAVRDGFFHADLHPGNLFVDREGRLCAVDFGIMGRLGLKERRFLAEILYGFITRDYRRVAEVHFEAGYVPEHHAVEDFAQAVRAILLASAVITTFSTLEADWEMKDCRAIKSVECRAWKKPTVMVSILSKTRRCTSATIALATLASATCCP